MIAISSKGFEKFVLCFQPTNLWSHAKDAFKFWNLYFDSDLLLFRELFSILLYFLNNKIIDLKPTFSKMKQVCIIINNIFFLSSNMNNKGLSHTSLGTACVKIIIINHLKYDLKNGPL